MASRLRQLSETRLRQQAGIEKSQTAVGRGILVQWLRNIIMFFLLYLMPVLAYVFFSFLFLNLLYYQIFR